MHKLQQNHMPGVIHFSPDQILQKFDHYIVHCLVELYCHPSIERTLDVITNELINLWGMCWWMSVNVCLGVRLPIMGFSDSNG
jgi:hypothetical protein